MGNSAAPSMKFAVQARVTSERMKQAGIRKLFGTDGIRGVAGEPPLDAKTIYATGLALGHSLHAKTQPKVLLGRDTRESSPWIASTLAAALRETGVQVESAGVVPTPAGAGGARGGGGGAGGGGAAARGPGRGGGGGRGGPEGGGRPEAGE